MRARSHIWLHTTLEGPWPHYMVSEVSRDGLWTLLLGSHNSIILALGSCVKWPLDYGEEDHRSVKNLSPRQGYLRQWLVRRIRWKKNFKNASSWISLEGKFLVWGFEVVQETFISGELPQLKVSSCWHPHQFFIHAWSSPLEKSWP